MLSGSGRTKELGEEFDSKEGIVEKVAGKNLLTADGVSTTKSCKKVSGQNLSSTTYNVPFQFVESGRRNQVMICEGRKYIQNNKYGQKIYWKCSKWHDGCKARAITLLTDPNCIIRRNEHNHPENSNDKDDM